MKNELKPCKHCGDVTCTSCTEAKRWEVLMMYCAIIAGGCIMGALINWLFYD